MYPLSDQELLIFELVEHWTRSIPEHPTFQELVTPLLQAYWRGDLQIVTSNAATMVILVLISATCSSTAKSRKKTKNRHCARNAGTASV